MRARAEFNVFVPVLHPVHNRYVGRDAEITGDIEHPKLAALVAELSSQILDIGVVELAEIEFLALQAVVPPDRVSIAFDKLEEALNDSFLQRIAGRAAVGIGSVEPRAAAVEEIQHAGRQISEALVAQRPGR